MTQFMQKAPELAVLKPTAIVSTILDSLTDSSGRKWETCAILEHTDQVQEEDQAAESQRCLTCACRCCSRFHWGVPDPTGGRRHFQEISFSNSVRELSDKCFRGCRNLRRVRFGSSSSLERIGISCFEWSAVEEVSIPDSVRELCHSCFSKCHRLRRVMFGSSSSL